MTAFIPRSCAWSASTRPCSARCYPTPTPTPAPTPTPTPNQAEHERQLQLLRAQLLARTKALATLRNAYYIEVVRAKRMLLESGLGIGYAQVAPDARAWVSQMVGPRRHADPNPNPHLGAWVRPRP